jgi:hypothetical protein
MLYMHMIWYHSGARWLRDVDLLKLDLVEFGPTEHQHRRSTFYLAKTFDWLNQKAEAYEYYEKRTQLGGWDEEIFQSYMRMVLSLSILVSSFI